MNKMDMQTPDLEVTRPESGEEPQGRIRGMVAGTLKVLLPVVILLGGGGLALGLITTGPTADQKPPVRQAKLVETSSVDFQTANISVKAMGTVGPDREVELRPRVSGQVVWLSDDYVPGGILIEGEPLLKIDPKDYQLVVGQKAAEVAKAESDLKIEQGQQAIAKREYEMLGQTVNSEDRELILRQPQLAQVKADLETAKSALAQAKLDLARTQVTVPFNAVIGSRDVNLGTQVTTTTTVATLVGTDSYLIEVAVPVNQLKWLAIPRNNSETGSAVRIFNEAAWGAGTYRTGHIVRLSSQLESEGRLAQLLVSVQDPLALKEENTGKPVLLIGAYVRVEIEGRQVGPVAVIERKLLHDGNNVWIMTPEETLEIRPIEILHRGTDTVLVDGGLQPGERIVTSALSAAVEGMALRTRDVAASEGQRTARRPNTEGTSGQ